MNALPRTFKPLVVVLVLVGGLVPPVLYLAVASIPPEVVVEASKAKELVGALSPMALLVDVRTPEEYAAGHLRGAVNWPASDILALKSFREATCAALGDETVIGRPLFLICSGGIESTRAARHLWRLGICDVRSVRGGMQAYVAATPRADCPLSLIAGGAGSPAAPVSVAVYRDSPPHEQWASVLTGFGVKPFYMVLALVLAAVLWRSRRTELVALRWGLVFFFIGEAFCAANYLAFHDDSYLSEYLHSFGMVLCFGFTTWAAFEGMDRWLIRYSDAAKTCAALPLCRQCIKHADVPCGLRRMFYLLIPATMVLACMPLTADFSADSYNTTILGTYYNYSHPIVYQVYEIRLLPVLALVLMAVSLAVLLLKKHEPVAWSKLFFAAAMGPLGFSLMRLFIYAPYHTNQVWFAFWEEITELLFVSGVAVVLWLFRKGLFADHAGEIASSQP
ncbi:MAG: rhodanese-like domain-containing protein [Planctomycetota bacterium]|nr:rhodanese-like domain-containing protein [Planctomycetota bacterium]